MPEAASWSAFQSHWDAMRAALPVPPCVLIDAAGVNGHLAALPMQALASFDSLFDGELADECADVAPYIAQAASWDEGVARALWPMVDRREAFLLWPASSALDCRALRRHLRKFNIVYDDTGKPHQFRYFDARVLLMLMESAPPVVDLRPLLRPLGGLLTVDAADEMRHIALLDGLMR